MIQLSSLLRPFDLFSASKIQTNGSIADNLSANTASSVQEPTDLPKASWKGNAKKADYDTYECQTCKNRKYKDGSNDPGVSFKTATHLSPEKAAFAVRSHEREHVLRERAKASRENREVVSQTVTYHTEVCPECGKTYIAGGNTRTVTKGQVDSTYNLSPTTQKGRYLDLTA